MIINVGTYNILHGEDYPHYLKTREPLIVLSNVSDAIKELGLDICGLNEVRNQENVEGLCNQVKVIAENIGYNYVFGKAINWRGGEYGNALVTKHEIVASKCIPIVVPADERIAGQPYEDRVLLCVDILIDGRIVTVMVTHFGLSEDEKNLAVKVIKEAVSQCENPLILMGDFNVQVNTAQYAALCEILSDTVSVVEGNSDTFPSNNPNIKIDYIFVNDKLKALKSFVPDVITSDHKPFVADIDIK